MNNPSFSNQINTLTDLSNEVYSFNSKLEGIYEDFINKLSSLHQDNGLMEEIYSVIQSRHISKIHSAVSAISSDISLEIVQFVEGEINFMTDRLDAYNRIREVKLASLNNQQEGSNLGAEGE